MAACAATGLEYQSPPAGSDTIYALAVDPADFPDDPFVYILDDGVVRVEADGTGSQTFRYVVQVLTRDAADGWAEQSFSYDAGRERFRINWVRVLDANGDLISDRPLHDQDGKSPAARQAPVYTDHRVRRISLAGVKPGSIIDYSYTHERTQPVIPGDFTLSWAVTTGMPTFRSRLVLDAPASMQPRISETNLDFEARVSEVAGRRIHEWITRDIPRIDPEPFAGWPNEVNATISVTGALGWSDIAVWYDQLSSDRYRMTPALAATAERLVQGAETRADTIAALHRWATQDIRYVSLSLGIGGYQPREPAKVVESGAGDCKDKSTLLVTALRHFGIEAYPVLTGLLSRIDESHPSIHAFDHMIVAIRSDDGSYLYTDPTADLVRLGHLPMPLEGEFGLLVRPEGAFETVTLPESTADANRRTDILQGEIDEAGRFHGILTSSGIGAHSIELRNEFRETFTRTQRDDFLRTVAGMIFPEAVGYHAEMFNGRDLSADATVAVSLRDGLAVTGAGPMRIFQLPIPTFSFHPLVREIEEKTPRRFPLSVESIVGPVENVWEVRVTLPEGWTAELPPPVSAESDFGRYRSEYAQEGRELRITRSISGSRGLRPPEAYPALTDWMRQVSVDDARHILLRTR